MRPTDIELLTSLSRPALAPDGSFALYASSRPDLQADRAVGQLWRIELDTEGDDPRPRRLTRGVSDTAPRLSPDGATVAFLRPDARGRRQLHLLDARGGEPLQLTDQLLGVGSFAWSPAGSRLAFTSRVPEQGRYGSVEDLGTDSESARRISGVRWSANGVGYTFDRPTQVFLVEATDPGTEPRYEPAAQPDGVTDERATAPIDPVQLTSEFGEHSSPTFTADGSAVLAVREDYESERRDLRTALISLPVTGKDTDVLLSAADGFRIARAGVADDGTVAMLASRPADGRDSVAPDVALWLLGEGEPRRLTEPETFDVASSGPDLELLGHDFLVRRLIRGRTHLLRVTRDGDVTPVLEGDVSVEGADAITTDGKELILASVSTPDSFGTLVSVEPPASVGGRSRARTLVDAGSALRETGLAQPRELEIDGRSGSPVHGWIAAPLGAGPFPTILMIHGGPYAAYGVSLFDEVQTLVAAGYAVAYCNPRGSAGYGRAHGRAVRQAFGTVDFEDVIDFLDGALRADERLDAERLGIMGGSYGGYLTAWTIAHDHRFRAAIVERGFLDPLSFQGTSDIGSYFGDEYIGTSSRDLERQSAFARAGQVRTPTLVIHAEQDLRCPLEQGTRYYTALRRAGVEAEMLIFPGEDHELTRTGSPRHRVERFEAVLDWWEQAFPTSSS